ncbi:hypothetical protein [Leptolyngbya sp. FACHB-17]|uniref:hypothetical protein n=1 Tax=unclassified Leptolyngbya TaxID=2650499 RepID=UPI0016802932|nr:hypothetical protein [Leptolyngbya sp. FACHB-17]MBD2078797.1 hypothetical protein [Leptolyngbya sp. FACHB-17]
MECSEAIAATRIENHATVKQPRSWVLCAFYLPDDAAENIPAIDLVKVRGQYLIGFNFRPSKGEILPYEGHLWRVKGEVVQFPARYRSRGRKDTPFVICEYVESCESEMQMFSRMLELSGNV